ncbi:unnamed protein product [Schistosoma margrebowiei]|uniref:Uncharacterized protein n=1 Tax=Schistosoma margrebowiei TaxID=48269 RepID=A0A183MB64_9TREM|nr:unnamed protein product [Schistosoma margrebowiei]
MITIAPELEGASTAAAYLSSLVRIRVQEVIDLIQDSEKLQQERQKAKANRHIYTGYGNTNDLDWGYSSYKNGGDYGQRS